MPKQVGMQFPGVQPKIVDVYYKISPHHSMSVKGILHRASEVEKLNYTSNREWFLKQNFLFHMKNAFILCHPSMKGLGLF